MARFIALAVIMYSVSLAAQASTSACVADYAKALRFWYVDWMHTVAVDRPTYQRKAPGALSELNKLNERYLVRSCSPSLQSDVRTLKNSVKDVIDILERWQVLRSLEDLSDGQKAELEMLAQLNYDAHMKYSESFERVYSKYRLAAE